LQVNNGNSWKRVGFILFFSTRVIQPENASSSINKMPQRCYTLAYGSFLKVTNGTCAWCLINIMFHAHRHQTLQERIKNECNLFKCKENFKALESLIYKAHKSYFSCIETILLTVQSVFFYELQFI